MKFMLVYIMVLGFFYRSCRQNQTQVQQQPSINKTIPAISVASFHTSLGWGYNIYRDSTIYIHQPTIPTIQGYKGFYTKEDAFEVGSIVAQKIRNGSIPPTISVEEMEKAGIWLKNRKE